MHVFIDTNVYLSFYHLTSDDLEELAKLGVLIENGQVTLWVPDQVRDEFSRNRDGKVADALKRFKDQRHKLQFPQICKDFSEYETLRDGQQQLEKAHAKLLEKLVEGARDRSLKADETIVSLFEKAERCEISDKTLWRPWRGAIRSSPASAFTRQGRRKSAWLRSREPRDRYVKGDPCQMTVKRLSILYLTLGSYWALGRYLSTYLRLAWAQFLLSGMIGLAFMQFSSEKLRLFGSGVFYLLFLVLLVPVVTAWHRLLILDRDDEKRRVRYAFSREEWLYIKAVVVLHFAYYFLALLIGILVAPALIWIAKQLPSDIPADIYEALNTDADSIRFRVTGLIIGFAAILCVVRFLLVLPAAAIGREMRVAKSGRVTQGNTWRLLAAYGLAWLPVWLIQEFQTGRPEDYVAGIREGLSGSPEIEMIVAMVPEFVFYTISVTVFSLSYRILVLGKPENVPGSRDGE